MEKQITQMPPGRNLALVAVLLILVAGVAAYFMVIPQLTANRQKQADTEGRLTAIQQDVQTLETARTEISKQKAALEARGVSFTDMSAHFPLNEDMPAIYLQFERVIAENPKLRDVTYVLGTPIDYASQGVQVPLSITVIGQYVDLKNLLGQLENEIRPMNISDVQMNEISTTVTGTGGNQQTVALAAGSYTMVVNGFIPAQALSSSFSAISQ